MPVACKIQEFRENILFFKIGIAQLLAVPGVADRFQYSGYHNAEVGDGISLRLYTFPGPVSFFCKMGTKILISAVADAELGKRGQVLIL